MPPGLIGPVAGAPRDQLLSCRFNARDAPAAGVSGQELTGRAYAQAQKFGAEIMIAKGATQLACDRQAYAVQIDAAVRVPARAVMTLLMPPRTAKSPTTCIHCGWQAATRSSRMRFTARS